MLSCEMPELVTGRLYRKLFRAIERVLFRRNERWQEEEKGQGERSEDHDSRGGDAGSGTLRATGAVVALSRHGQSPYATWELPAYASPLLFSIYAI